VFNRTNIVDQFWGTGSRLEKIRKYFENTKLYQPEGAGRYLSEKTKIQTETYFSKTAEIYFPEETGGRILINLLAIK
jgi:hypothetical protein